MARVLTHEIFAVMRCLVVTWGVLSDRRAHVRQLRTMFVDLQRSNIFQDDVEKAVTVAMMMGLLAEINSGLDNAQADGDYPEPDFSRDLTHTLTFNPDLLRRS